MYCYNHPDRDAVATCCKCGKSLCKECADKYHPCLCDNCYKVLRQKEIDDLKAARKQLIKTFAISCALAFVCAMITTSSGSESFPWVFTVIAFFAPWGWGYGNLFGLRWFFNTNPAGCIIMVLFYLFKAIVSAIIGVFCFIAALIKYVKIKKAEKTVEIEMNN